MATTSTSTSVDKSVATGLVKNAIHCVGEDKLLKCLEIEMKEMEQEILVAGDMEQTVFKEFCTQLTSLLKCLIVSTDKLNYILQEEQNAGHIFMQHRMTLFLNCGGLFIQR